MLQLHSAASFLVRPALILPCSPQNHLKGWAIQNTPSTRNKRRPKKIKNRPAAQECIKCSTTALGFQISQTWSLFPFMEAWVSCSQPERLARTQDGRVGCLTASQISRKKSQSMKEKKKGKIVLYPPLATAAKQGLSTSKKIKK